MTAGPDISGLVAVLLIRFRYLSMHSDSDVVHASSFGAWLNCKILKKDDFKFRMYSKFCKGFRSFNAKNLRSIDQKASKLLVVKFGGLKKKSAAQPRLHSNQLARIGERTGSNHSQSLMPGNFAALWPTDPKCSLLKNLYCK